MTSENIQAIWCNSSSLAFVCYASSWSSLAGWFSTESHSAVSQAKNGEGWIAVWVNKGPWQFQPLNLTPKYCCHATMRSPRYLCGGLSSKVEFGSAGRRHGSRCMKLHGFHNKFRTWQWFCLILCLPWHTHGNLEMSWMHTIVFGFSESMCATFDVRRTSRYES